MIYFYRWMMDIPQIIYIITPDFHYSFMIPYLTIIMLVRKTNFRCFLPFFTDWNNLVRHICLSSFVISPGQSQERHTISLVKNVIGRGSVHCLSQRCATLLNVLTVHYRTAHTGQPITEQLLHKLWLFGNPFN